MTRKVRSDCTVGSLEKKLNIPNCITNPSGRNTRSDKLIKNLRKDFEKLIQVPLILENEILT